MTVPGRPLLGHLRLVGRSRVLLKDEWPPCHPVDPWLHYCLQRSNVAGDPPERSVVASRHPRCSRPPGPSRERGTWSASPLEPLWGRNRALLSFFLLTFWSWSKFFPSEKNHSIPGSSVASAYSAGVSPDHAVLLRQVRHELASAHHV